MTSESRDLIKQLSFCVFDLETTGGNHQSDKIIEIGLVRVKNLEVVAEKNFLVKPEIRIPEFIQKLTSIKENDVIDAPIIEELMDEILEFMGDDILVAHNTSFDIPFFNSVLRRLDREELKNKAICTNLMTKYLIPNLLNSNLNYMCRIFNIDHHKAHRASDDAKAAAELLLKYLDIFIHKNINKINHLYYPRNRFELDQSNYKQGSSLDEIDKKIDSLGTSFLAVLKGENGVINFAFPSKGSEQEKNFIKTKLREINWTMATIKLTGPFFDTLVQFSGLFNKIEQNYKDEILQLLREVHLSPSSKKQDSKIYESNDFIITHHLVPEQMMIYPLSSLHRSSGLIFRYPGHKKKLIQYINSKTIRIENNKLKQIFISPPLKSFIADYLEEKKQSDEFFIFKKRFPHKDPGPFFEQLDQFLLKNPYSYNYPKEYI